MSQQPPPYPGGPDQPQQPGEPGSYGPPPTQPYGTPPPPPAGGGYGAPMPPPPPGEIGPDFSVGAAIGYGWRAFKANWQAFVGMTLIMLVVASIFSTISQNMDNRAAAGLVNVVGQAVSYIFGAGLIKGALDATAGRPVSIGEMFQGWDKLQVIVAAVLIAIGTTIGLILLIIPGLIWAFMTWFTTYFVVDARADAIASIKSSIGLVKDNAGPLFVLMLACIGVAILGTLALLVGLLVAVPVIYIAGAYAFRVLQGQQVAIQR